MLADKEIHQNFMNVTPIADDVKESASENKLEMSQFRQDLNKKLPIDRPVMDSSLPYIPVYTHLTTHDLTPVKRPPTPPVIKKLRAKSISTTTPESEVLGVNSKKMK